MRKIIQGKVYDTETADLVASETFSSPGDFRHTFQELYVTKKGNYFFHGGGGPLTEYAVSTGNNTTSGSSRIWLPEGDEMEIWLSNADPEKAIELFEIEEA